MVDATVAIESVGVSLSTMTPDAVAGAPGTPLEEGVTVRITVSGASEIESSVGAMVITTLLDPAGMVAVRGTLV